MCGGGGGGLKWGDKVMRKCMDVAKGVKNMGCAQVRGYVRTTENYGELLIQQSRCGEISRKYGT